jgi:iron complex outermembrane receptor protein
LTVSDFDRELAADLAMGRWILQIAPKVCVSLVALAAASAAWPTIAIAQRGTTVTTAGVAEESTGLSEIVVTAQKRDQNLQNVPVSVSSITGDQLSSVGVVDTTQLNIAVPAINIRVTNSSFSPSIRGIGTAAINVENPVALYIDGVYYPSQREGLRDFNDVEQVSVLKGPQGTLFGRNATGGVVQISTKRPSFDTSGEVGVSIDNYATLRTNAYLTGGLAHGIAASLSGSYVTQGKGWGKNFTTGADTYKIDYNWSLRGQLLIEPGPGTSIRIIGDYGRRSDNQATYFRPYPGTPLRIPGIVTPPNIYDSIVGLDPLSKLQGGGVSATIEQDLGFAKLTSISAYRNSVSAFRLDADATPFAIFHVDSPETRAKSFSQELQLGSKAGSSVNWAAGIYYFNSSNTANNFSQSLGGPLAPLPTSVAKQMIFGREKVESIAPFGQLDFEILPQTRLTLGARWTYEKRQFDSSQSNLLNNGSIVPLVVPYNGASFTEKKPTWRIALDHQFSKAILGYVSLTRGFKTGGFNILNPANPPYKTEQLDAYEVGLKTEFFDRHLRLNMAGFYYDYSNLQVQQFVNGAQLTVNGAKAKLYGLDVDFEAILARGLSVRGGFVLLHNEFTSFPNALIFTQLPGGGVSSAPGDASGHRLPNAQDFSGSISLNYDTDVSFGRLNFNATESHNGAFVFEADNFLRQRAYDIVNASANWTSLHNRFGVSLFVKNLFNAEVLTHATSIPLGQMATQYLAPRIYGISGRVRF